MEFLSTLSLRRATLQAPPPRRPQRHFYPRSPCGERQRTQAGSRHNTAISIHALLAESDQQSRGSYIRTEKFLSTLSLRRATNPVVDVRRATGTAISIHALLAESDCRLLDTRIHTTISIHALLAESDNIFYNPTHSIVAFLSTLSLRRATIFKLGDQSITVISIHALLAESDMPTTGHPYSHYNFYPRSPCGERPTDHKGNSSGTNISIHALLAESDPMMGPPRHKMSTFLSTLSLRRATQILGLATGDYYISIHALLAESD